MLRGSCLCGSVRYEIVGEPALMYHCHCATCRKASGASFATNILVAFDSFLLVAGQAALSSHESSPGKRRHFCGSCGSPIYSHAESTKHFVSVRCGTLEGDSGVDPSYHSWVTGKAPWTKICDGLPEFPQGVG